MSWFGNQIPSDRIVVDVVHLLLEEALRVYLLRMISVLPDLVMAFARLAGGVLCEPQEQPAVVSLEERNKLA